MLGIWNARPTRLVSRVTPSTRRATRHTVAAGQTTCRRRRAAGRAGTGERTAAGARSLVFMMKRFFVRLLCNLKPEQNTMLWLVVLTSSSCGSAAYLTEVLGQCL